MSTIKFSVALLLVGAALAVQAAPSITPLGEADKHGAINYSVKCDSGARKIVQCVRDDGHCGYAGDQSLADIVAALCSGSPPEPAATTPSMQTAPATP
ncbi:MAG: hypothetical protein ACT4PG_12170 [Panacagrimonas sp.]